MSQEQVRMRLTREGFREGSPARRIIDLNGGIWGIGNAQAQITSLAQNFFTVGQQSGWIWHSGGNGIGNPMKDAAGYGRPLLNGQINGTNCGGFGGAFRKLAEIALEIPTNNNKGTGCTDSFITVSGNQGIDSNWQGNVRTLSQDFNMFNAYMFTNHGWSDTNGLQIDVSTNSIVQSKLEFFGCRLQKISSDHYLVALKHNLNHIPGLGPYYCFRVSKLKDLRHHLPVILTGGEGEGMMTQSFINGVPNKSGGGNWGNMILLSRHHISDGLANHFNI